MKMINFLYKCRQCGEIANNLGTGGEHYRGVLLLVDAIEGKTRETMSPKLLDIHCCKTPGQMGVSDLIGYNTTENE